MTPISQTLDRAIQFHQAGDFQQAERYYKSILQADPQHAEALHLLGVLCHQMGRDDLAVTYIGEALRLKPNFPEAHTNLGGVLRQQGRLDEAVASLRQALHFDPNCAEAYNNLGNALRDQKKLDEAIAALKQCLRLRPGYAETHHNLGVVYREQGKLDEAVECYREALRLRPGYAEAHNSLGNVFKRQGKLEEAAQCYRQALFLKPSLVEVHNFLGLVLQQQGKLDEALACYSEALRHKPDYFEAHFNRGILLLLHGDLERGWQEYEWRWRDKNYNPCRFSQPLWDGSDLKGKTILFHAEQGIGDAIQFVRYAPLIQKRGGTVLFECPAPLTRLFANLPGIDRLVPADSPLPAFDVHLPLLSAPGIFGTTLATIPADIPYVFAERVASASGEWRVASDEGPLHSPLATRHSPLLVATRHSPLLVATRHSPLLVGVSWQGNPDHLGDRYRSFPLKCFEALARVQGVRLFSLQKGFGTEQLTEVNDLFPVVDLGSQFRDFMDMAAVMMNLDLVVTVDSAPAHLAGALGIPVWVALPLVPDWRWLLNRADSPWYPTMRLFRQTTWGDWNSVFERMAKALSALVADR